VIIFGFRSFVKTLGMLTLVCRRCGNPAAHRVAQRSRWFTLFFIPLIPLGFKRYTVCAFCGAAQQISKEQAEQLLASQGQLAPTQPGVAVPPPLDGAQPAPGTTNPAS
jgi:hypothetical protein